MEKEIDFEEQLKLEALEKERKEREAVGTYTDKDGVVFEFDAEKKAWFPKVHVQHWYLLFGGFLRYMYSMGISVLFGGFLRYIYNIGISVLFWGFPNVHLQHWYLCCLEVSLGKCKAWVFLCCLWVS